MPLGPVDLLPCLITQLTDIATLRLSHLVAHAFLIDSILTDFALSSGYPFPYLYDESQEVARDYEAKCTPEFYLLDREHKLQYHGQFDDSRPSNGIPVTGNSMHSHAQQPRHHAAGFALTVQNPSTGASQKSCAYVHNA